MGQDLGLIIAIIAGSATIIASTIAMFLWQRSEANTDRRHFQDIQREDRKDLLNICRSMQLTMHAIETEMKDFHTRLLQVDKNIKEMKQ